MRTCTVEGCARQHRARGYCAAHYNKILAPDRHRTIITCAECGVEHETSRTNGRYCSLECAHAEQRRTREAKAAAKAAARAIVGPLPWTRRPLMPPPPAKAVRRVFVQGACGWCGETFTALTMQGGPLARYCSKMCSRRATDSRHRATRGNGHQHWIAPSRRYRIYERDQWTCQLCGGEVERHLPYNDTWAASLDHITPRSQGGTHADDNLRLAHRWCNAVRDEGAKHGLFAVA